MGEYAEMMLDGTCCCSCGEFLGDGDGFAVYCASCKPEEVKAPKLKIIKAKQIKTVRCANKGCARKFVDENAARQHLRQFHHNKIN